MASRKLPRHAQAVIEKCELCDRDSDARFFCTDCQEEMCKQCKTTHLRSKVSRHHNIINIADDIEPGSKDQVSGKSVFCLTHPKEQVQMYCISCKVLVCLTCIADKQHKNHTFDKIADAVDNHRKNLSTLTAETKQEISGLESSLQAAEENDKDYTTQSDNIIDKINTRRHEWKSQIDKTADNLILQLKEYQSKDLQAIKNHIQEINKTISEKKDLLQTCEDVLQSEYDVSIIRFTADTNRRLQQPKKLPMLKLINPPDFICGDPVNVRETFGHLENYEDKENLSVCADAEGEVGKLPDSVDVADTEGQVGKLPDSVDMAVCESNINTTTVADIAPGIQSLSISVVNNSLAWCGQGHGVGYEIALINLEGQVKNKIKLDFKFFDITITSTGELLLTNHDGHQIKKYSQDNGQFIDFADFSPYETRGLCHTSDNDILVCLFRVGQKIIKRLTLCGEINQTIELDKHNKPLFKDPRLIAENINKDVCIVDNLTTVVVVNKDGILRFRYPDSGNSSISNCYGIACDKLGYILVSDLYNNWIHQIDKDGRFVRYVLTKQHGINRPWGLSVDDRGQLWLCNTGKIIVVKYRSNSK